MKHMERTRIARGRSGIWLLCLLVSLLMQSKAFAEKLIIGIDQSFQPFSYVTEEGEFVGLYVEIVSGALDAAGMEYELRGYPWKRLVLNTDLAELDLAMPFRHKAERFEKYHMIGPFTRTGSRTFFYGRQDSQITWQNLRDLKGHLIGMIDGFAYPDKVETSDHLDFYKVNGSTQKLAFMLHLQRIDLLVSDETVFWDAVRRSELDHAFKPIGQPLETVSRYVAMPRSKTELAVRVRAAMDQFQQSDSYRQILTKYGLQY